MTLQRWTLALAILAAMLAQTPAETQDVNPLLKPSSLPFQAPAFDKISNAHFLPAIEEGITQRIEEVAAIANSPAAPTFANTIEAMERTGQLLERSMSVFENLAGSNTNPELQKIERTIAPRLASANDEIFLNAKLFQRVKTIYDQRASLALDAESKHLVDLYYRDFVRAGALLNDADKKKLRALNEEESSLETDYSQKRLAANNAAAVVVDDKAQLDGLTDADIAAAAQEAAKRKMPGKWVLTLQNTTQQPYLSRLKNRALRKRIFDASIMRGTGSGPDATERTVARLAQIRAQKARLLGFPTFAAYALDTTMAGTPDNALKLVMQVATASTAKAREETARMQKLVDRDGGGFKVEAWDWDYYAERVRKADYEFDEDEVRPYFELDRVLKDGVFFAATRLYGMTFTERTDLPVYDSDVRVFDVHDVDGKPLGLFYADFFERPNKDGGAWMNSFVRPSKLLDRKAVVINNTNFVKPAPGQPILLTPDNVRTMFHEFGHALHYLSFTAVYPRSTRIVRDFVEFPSQFNEHWALDPLVLANYAKHYKTGAAMPQALAEKIKKTGTFNQGYSTTEAQAASLLDFAWHTLPADAPLQNVQSFEAAALKKFNVDLPQVPPRYRSTYFTHIWSNGYSARYYAYLWTKVLDTDAYDWFLEHGGLTRANGDRFRTLVLSRAGQADFAQIYRDFRGRDPVAEPLLKERGLDKR
jgi:peptidyl-dipeptidase Dcp